MVQQEDKISHTGTKIISTSFIEILKSETSFRNRLHVPQDHLKNLIEMSIQKYYSRIAKKLTTIQKIPKTFPLYHPSFMKTNL